MSTSYMSPCPLTIKQAEDHSEWKYHKNAEGHEFLTDGRNFIEVWEFEFEGKTYLSLERWGRNNVSDIVEALGLVSEHDDAFWHLPWNKPEDEEAEDEDPS